MIKSISQNVHKKICETNIWYPRTLGLTNYKQYPPWDMKAIKNINNDSNRILIKLLRSIVDSGVMYD